MANKTDCVFCGKEVDILEKFNGEMGCQECYNDPENNVFGDDSEVSE